MKTRILTIAMVLLTGIMFSNSASAGKKAVKFASSLENIAEPSSKIESWMLSDLMWQPVAMLEMVTVCEESLHLEDWMVNNALWDRIEKAEEAVLELQPWMTSSLVWEKSEPMADDRMNVESWMSDKHYWTKRNPVANVEKDKALGLEDWMVNTQIWKS
jgi:hypothetical protein